MQLMKCFQIQLSNVVIFITHKRYGKKSKEYGLKQLSKEEHIKKQIANIIGSPLVLTKQRN